MYNSLFEGGRYMHGWGNGFDGGFTLGPGAFIGLTILGILFAVWFIISIALKGYALWTAAKRGEKWWFIALLVINTMGILELLYLLFIAKVSFGKCHKNCKHCDSEKCNAEDTERMDPENEENTKKEAEEVM
jgi:hypothetical protein